MNENSSKKPLHSSSIKKIFLWGLFFILLSAFIYANPTLIERVFNTEIQNNITNYYDLVNDGYGLIMAILITLAILWLIFFYRSTLSIKKFLKKQPIWTQFLLSSIFWGSISGYFFWLVIYNVFSDFEFDYFIESVGFVVIVSSILIPILSAPIFNRLKKLNKEYSQEASFRRSITIGCVLGGILSVCLVFLYFIIGLLS